MNSEWKTVSRTRRAEGPDELLSVNGELAPQDLQGLRFLRPRDGAAQRLQEPLSVLRRAQEVCRFKQTGEFVCSTQRNARLSAAGNDHGLPVVCCPVEQAGQASSSSSIGGLDGHSLSCTDSLYRTGTLYINTISLSSLLAFPSDQPR